ncbi:MAG: phosphoribosyltransferase [Chthoniobacterales bacterium]
MQFTDRAEAGRLLAAKLSRLAHRPDVIVLALPCGGVPVAYEVALSLGAPLDVFVVRKLGVPQQPELAMGAIASGGTRVLNRHVVEALGPEAMQVVERVTARESEELRAREIRYRGDRPFLELRGRAVVLVDDGLATGATMRAAARAVRLREPAELIIAVPVAAAESCRELEDEADEVICAFTPEAFFGVGQFYDNFSQTTDEEVRRCLEG